MGIVEPCNIQKVPCSLVTYGACAKGGWVLRCICIAGCLDLELSEAVSLYGCCQRACELGLGDCQRPWVEQPVLCPKQEVSNLGVLTHVWG